MAQFTQREFLYLDDLMSMVEIEAAKCRSMAQQLNDPQLKQLCQNAAQRHEQHFTTLLRHLNQAQGQRGQASYQQAYQGTAQPGYQPGQTGFQTGYQQSGFSQQYQPASAFQQGQQSGVSQQYQPAGAFQQGQQSGGSQQYQPASAFQQGQQSAYTRNQYSQ